MGTNGKQTAGALFSLLLCCGVWGFFAPGTVLAASFAAYGFSNENLLINGFAADLDGDGETEYYAAKMRLRTNGKWELQSVEPYKFISPVESSFAGGVVRLSRLHVDFDGDGGYEATYAVEIQLFSTGDYSVLSAVALENVPDGEDKTPPGQDLNRDCFPGLTLMDSWAFDGDAYIRLVYESGLHYYRTYKQWFPYDFYIQYAPAHTGEYGRAIYMQIGHADGSIWLDGDCDGCEGIDGSVGGGGLRVWVSNASLPQSSYECIFRTVQRANWP